MRGYETHSCTVSITRFRYQEAKIQHQGTQGWSSVIALHLKALLQLDSNSSLDVQVAAHQVANVPVETNDKVLFH